MNAMQAAVRILIAIASHPTSQRIAKAAIRQATAELVRYIQKGTSRTHVPKSY